MKERPISERDYQSGVDILNYTLQQKAAHEAMNQKITRNDAVMEKTALNANKPQWMQDIAEVEHVDPAAQLQAEEFARQEAEQERKNRGEAIVRRSEELGINPFKALKANGLYMKEMAGTGQCVPCLSKWSDARKFSMRNFNMSGDKCRDCGHERFMSEEDFMQARA
jgi:hypothetical protein